MFPKLGRGVAVGGSWQCKAHSKFPWGTNAFKSMFSTISYKVSIFPARSHNLCMCFFQESQRSRNSLERLGQSAGFVGGFFFLFVVVLVVVQTISGSRAGTRLPTSLLHEHPARAPPARNTSTRTPPGAPTPFGKSSSGFETAEADFQGKAVQSCIDSITWFYLNSLAEIIHLR